MKPALPLLGFTALPITAAVTLNFDTAVFSDSFGNSNGDPEELRWSNIGNFNGIDLDLVATTAAGSTYVPGSGPVNASGPLPAGGQNPGSNVPEGATRIKVQRNTDVTFDFIFVNQSTGNAVVLDEFVISFWDFDLTDRTAQNQGIVDETLTFLGLGGTDTGASFTYTTGKLFDIDTSNPNQPIFRSTQAGSQSDNPSDLTNLTEEQEDKVIELTFSNAASFRVNLAVGGTSSSDARTFFVGGDVTFDPSTPITTEPVPDPPSIPVPEPSVPLTLLLSSALFWRRLR
ncbi:MAG: hypothetical protein AAGC74_05670 [Verrucomicrobiota bacterium]